MSASDVFVSVVVNKQIHIKFLKDPPKMKNFYHEGKAVFVQACKKSTELGCPICTILQQSKKKCKA